MSLGIGEKLKTPHSSIAAIDAEFTAPKSWTLPETHQISVTPNVTGSAMETAQVTPEAAEVTTPRTPEQARAVGKIATKRNVFNEWRYGR